MVDPTYSQELRTAFGGSYLLEDAPDVPPSRALLAENVSYIPGFVQTRLGFSQAYDPNEPMSALFNWISSLGDLLLWFRTSDRSVRLIDIASPSVQTVISGDLLGYAATFANAGARLYAAFFAASGLGASGARVISYQGAAYVNDLCFRPPITYVPSAPTETTTGTVTQGVHNLAYRIEYRSGFITRPSPDTGVGTPSVSTFTPVPFASAGGQNLVWTLNTTWPTGAVNVYLLMTPVANPSQYFFVPGAVQAVVGGVASAITFTVDIADELLFATGQDSTSALFLLTNTVVDTPPFFPSVVGTHGDRMFYVTTVSDNIGNSSGAVYMSDKGAYQEIAADKSLIQLPGQLDISTAISLNGLFYMFGPQWTYETLDNGSDPVTWAAAKLVDGKRGTPSPRGVEKSPSGNYAWVAVPQDGLYYFQAGYANLPISYFQTPDWNRINWDAAEVLQIKDDPGIKKVYVMAALDDATTPSHMLTWDYTNGFTPDVTNYSLDSLQDYDLGAMEVVKNGLTGMPTGIPQKKELWIGSSSNAPILRRNSSNDTDPYLDDSMPIFSNYETSLFPRQGTRGEVYQHHGADIRVKGEGTLQARAYTLDHDQSFDLLDTSLSANPGKIVHRGVDLISEGVSYLFTQGLNLIVDGDFETV